METLDRCISCDSSQILVACSQNHFARCDACGLIFDNPRPEWSEIVTFYSKHDKYDDWLREEAGRDALWTRRLRMLRRFVSSGRLLDVGAGIGQFLAYAKKYFDVYGTEISPIACEIASKKYGIALERGTLEDLEFSESYDVLTMIHVLEHVPRPAETLKKCFRLLNPGGVLYIAVPNDIDSWFACRNRFLRKMGLKKYRPLGETGLPALTLGGSEIHLSHFSEQILRTVLQGVGFRVLATGLDPYFSVTGMRKVRRYRRYFWYRAVYLLTGKNLYDTFFIVAQKPEEIARNLRNA